MSLDKIDKIKSISKSLKTQGLERLEGPQAPNREQFDALMRQEAVKKDPVKVDGLKPSPMEEARNNHHRFEVSRKTSHRELIAQLDDTINRLDKVKDTLNVSNDLQLKNSMSNIMRKKLEHIDESLKAALSRVGTEFEGGTTAKPVEPSDKILGPVERFLGLLSEGQEKLYSLSSEIDKMGTKQHLSPASMLAIQIKVNMVQQQIELFTALLNKALESTKTIMNVQV